LRRRILPHIRSWQQRFRVPFVYVTHSVEEALSLANHVIRLDEGRVVDQGDATRVLSHGFLPSTSNVDESDSILRLEVFEQAEGVCRARCSSLELEVPPQPDLKIGDTFFAALAARDVVVCQEAIDQVSARNCIPARVAALQRQTGLVRVEFTLETGTASLGVQVTERSAAELTLEVGETRWLLFKATALRRL
jgi:molybdate transport system ATP-binding protein